MSKNIQEHDNYLINKSMLTKSILVKSILILSDVLALIISLIIATAIISLIRPNEPWSVNFNHLGLAKLVGLLIIVVFWYQEQYTKRRPIWEELRQVYGIIIIFAVLHFGFTYLLAHHIIKLLNVVFWLLLLIVLPTLRYCAKLAMIKFGIWFKDVYIIGTGDNAYETFKLLGGNAKNNIMGYCIKGLIDITVTSTTSTNSNTAHNNIAIGKIDKIDRVDNIAMDNQLNLPIYGYDFLLNLSNSNLDPNDNKLLNSKMFNSKIFHSNTNPDLEIICALPTEYLLKYVHEINLLQTRYDAISIIPDIKGLPLYGVELNHFFGSDQLFLRLQNNLGRRVNRVIKRSIDICLSFIGLIVLLPVFLCFAIIIKSTTNGAIFFKHRRIGSGGKMFECIKFQTMYLNSQELLANYLANNAEARNEWEHSFKLKHDPRVTKIGKFLRKTSLDELPQLWNVLIGQMSLVGPRPITDAEISKYGEDFYYYKLVRPGVTGLWQVSGRSGVDYVNRVRFDVWYVKNWSLWYDSVILLKTIGVVIGGSGAY